MDAPQGHWATLAPDGTGPAAPHGGFRCTRCDPCRGYVAASAEDLRQAVRAHRHAATHRNEEH